MPFSFGGTFNKSQFERLVSHAQDQLTHIDARIKHLTYEQTRIGFLKFTYDAAGRPEHYSTGGEGGSPTYIGKLMQAYEVLGGDPFHELQTRSMDQPVFLPQGTETTAPKVMSNGEPIPGQGLADAPTSQYVSLIKSWMSANLERRAALERKIRRMLDYGDQLQIEIDQLKNIRLSAETQGSLENVINEVNLLFGDKNYRAVTDDTHRPRGSSRMPRCPPTILVRIEPVQTGLSLNVLEVATPFPVRGKANELRSPDRSALPSPRSRGASPRANRWADGSSCTAYLFC
jgi:hypothetical protein